MSYATSLLMAYPPPYGPSTLLSDDLVQRSSLGPFYEPSVPYVSGGRLLSDNLIGLGSANYHSPTYSHFPTTTNYRTSSITDWQRDIPQPTSYAPTSNIREYSESLGTASNTTTASSIAHSIDENNLNGSMNKFPDYQQSYNRLLNDVDRSPYLKTIWSPTRSKNDEKPTHTHRSVPELSTTIIPKKSPIEELKKDKTPIPSSSPPVLPKQETNPTLIETEKQQPSVDIQSWLIETKNDGKAAEQAWTVKIDNLHTIQAQREKEKAKPSRTLPTVTKKIDTKPRITSFQKKNDSYFDSLFDGNYLRRTSINPQNLNSSYQQILSSRNKSTTYSFNKPKTTFYPKYVPPRKTSQYEPPTVNRVQPTVATTSWQKQGLKQIQRDSIIPRENIHKDTDDRFREALQKFRSDRAEQQQKESNESTAKRLHYGDYVRYSTKDDLLQNAIKPSPWSDFMDMKKGNLYSLTKEEKKDLYNQSRSYGERVRYRNFALHNNGETTARTQRRSIPFPIQNQEPESDDEPSHEPVINNDKDSKSSKRPDSTSTIKTTNKTYTKQTVNSDMISNRSSRATKLTDQSSSTIRPSEDENDDISDFESSHKQKKRLYDSSVRTTTSATEDSENDETSEQYSIRMKNRETDDDDDLFTVREEKTLESLEGARYKKR